MLPLILVLVAFLLAAAYLYTMSTGVQGCKFCELVREKKELHVRDGDNSILVRDIRPKASHHYLSISKMHIGRPTDLTAADIPMLEEMEKQGREFLRAELKVKGEADTIEDMLRVGFHWPPLITVNHLHMHIIYPIKDLNLISRMLTYRPGKAFKETRDVIEDLRKAAGVPDPLEGNPAKDEEAPLSAHVVSN